MTLLIRRQTCLRIWKRSQDVLFQAGDSTAGLQVRRRSQPYVHMSTLDQPKQSDSTPETSTNCTTEDSRDVPRVVDQFTVGNYALTKLCQLLKRSLQQECDPSYISQLRGQKCDSSSSYKHSQRLERCYNKQNVNFLNYMASAESKFFVGSETLPELHVRLDTLPWYNVCSPTCQNTPLHRQLLTSQIQHQLSSYNVSQCGNDINVNYPMRSHQVKHYSVSQFSSRHPRYSNNRKDRLLSVQHHITAPSVHYSSLAINSNSWHVGVRQAHVLTLEPLLACGLMRRWISKNEYTFPELKEKDLVESFMRGGGAGGQAVAKTNNCVLLLHKPTGLQVKMHVSRSLEDNRKKAREKMIEKLDFHYNGENSFAEQKKAEKRKAKQKMKKKAELIREKMKAFKEGLDKNDDGPDGK